MKFDHMHVDPFLGLRKCQNGPKAREEKIWRGKIGPRLGEKIDRLEVYTPLTQCSHL